MTEKSSRNRTKTFLVILFSLLIATAGIVLIYLGIKPPEDAPIPPRDIVASKGQLPVGPSTSDINGSEMTPEKMEPNHLFIPSINAYSPIVDTKVSSGELQIPKDPTKVARWEPSAPLSSSEGNTLLAGHVRYLSDKGSLFYLANLEPGAKAYVKDSQGILYEFQLQTLYAVIKKDLPPAVWEVEGIRQLTVVTCGGPVDETPTGNHYRDNVIATFIPTIH